MHWSDEVARQRKCETLGDRKRGRFDAETARQPSGNSGRAVFLRHDLSTLLTEEYPVKQWRSHGPTRVVPMTQPRTVSVMMHHANAELRKTPSAEQNMGMPIGQMRHWSVEDVWALPEDGNRYEVVDGALFVTPSPRRAHQLVAGEFFHELRTWLKGPGLSVGVVFMAPVDVVLDPNTLVQPDVVVLPARDRSVLLGEGPAPQPVLAIEVLSPGTARNDRLTKRPRFQRAGVECWLVDIDAQRVEQWAPAAETAVVCTDELAWAPAGATEAFRMALAPIWAGIDC